MRLDAWSTSSAWVSRKCWRTDYARCPVGMRCEFSQFVATALVLKSYVSLSLSPPYRCRRVCMSALNVQRNFVCVYVCVCSNLNFSSVTTFVTAYRLAELIYVIFFINFDKTLVKIIDFGNFYNVSDLEWI